MWGLTEELAKLKAGQEKLEAKLAARAFGAFFHLWFCFCHGDSWHQS
jgi:hypothetical protein